MFVVMCCTESGSGSGPQGPIYTCRMSRWSWSLEHWRISNSMRHMHVLSLSKSQLSDLEPVGNNVGWWQTQLRRAVEYFGKKRGRHTVEPHGTLRVVTALPDSTVALGVYSRTFQHRFAPLKTGPGKVGSCTLASQIIRTDPWGLLLYCVPSCAHIRSGACTKSCPL